MCAAAGAATPACHHQGICLYGSNCMPVGVPSYTATPPLGQPYTWHAMACRQRHGSIQHNLGGAVLGRTPPGVFCWQLH